MTPRSRHFWAIVVATACVAGAVSGVGEAQNFGSAPVAEEYFRIDAEAGVTGSGRAVVRGYVHNRSPYDVGKIRLRVDAAPRATPGATPVAMGWVNGELERGGRRYFEVAVPRADVSYRVSVESFEVLFNDLNG